MCELGEQHLILSEDDDADATLYKNNTNYNNITCMVQHKVSFCSKTFKSSIKKKSVHIILPMFFLLFTICRYMYKVIYKNRCKCEQMALWASETIVNYISHRKQILKHFIFRFLTTIISCLL